MQTVYFLTSHLSPGPTELNHQRGRLLASLQPAGVKKTLDQLVVECLSLGYKGTFRKTPKPEHMKMETARSILFHLIEMEDLIGSEELNS